MLVTADFLLFPPIYPCALVSGCMPQLTAPSLQPAPSLCTPAWPSETSSNK